MRESVALVATAISPFEGAGVASSDTVRLWPRPRSGGAEPAAGGLAVGAGSVVFAWFARFVGATFAEGVVVDTFTIGGGGVDESPCSKDGFTGCLFADGCVATNPWPPRDTSSPEDPMDAPGIDGTTDGGGAGVTLLPSALPSAGAATFAASLVVADSAVSPPSTIPVDIGEEVLGGTSGEVSAAAPGDCDNSVVATAWFRCEAVSACGSLSCCKGAESSCEGGNPVAAAGS